MLFIIILQEWEDEPGINYLIHKDEHNKYLVDMPKDTARGFLASEGKYADATMADLDTKFRFLHNYKQTPRKMGEVYRYECKYPKEILYGLVVKDQKSTDKINFQAMEIACKALSKLLIKDGYSHLAIEAFYDESDATVMEKIITIMKWTLGRNCKNTVSLYTCYPKHVMMLRGNYEMT